MARPALKACAVLAGLVLVPAVSAFSVIGLRWDGGSAVFHMNFSGGAPSGPTWSDAFREAMDEWTALTPFTFVADTAPVDPCLGYSRSSSGRNFPAGSGDARNSAGFSATVCENDFGNTVLAVTLNIEGENNLGFTQLAQSDIVFNSAFDWDVYDGPVRSDTVDFRRVALHELGHALGLGHEQDEPAIMAPNISSLSSLQADDIAGVSTIYGSGDFECLVTDLELNAAVSNSLDEGDCRVLDLFNGSNDTSFVDVYRLTLSNQTTLNIAMASAELDSVLIITNPNLGQQQIHDDFAGTCDARFSATLPAGEYLLLANTFDVVQKCVGNTGAYNLTVTDSPMPVLGPIKNASGSAVLASALIAGGASADGGQSFKNSFGANEAFSVQARIAPDPQHVGLDGFLYVLVTLGDGRQFMQNAGGTFQPFPGGLANLVPVRSGPLAALETLDVVQDLRGSTSGLAGASITVHVGYAIQSSPQDLYYGANPIVFTIAPL